MIGIFGGTFDPVHFGHLRPALELRECLALEEVLLVPARQPPHRDSPTADAHARLRMLESAVAGVHGLRVDDRELRRSGPSYMVDTLSSLREEIGAGAAVALLLGSDAFAGLDQWHRWRELFALAHIVVAHRPGWPVPSEGELGRITRERAADSTAELAGADAGRVLFRAVTQLEISATQIRELVAAGRSPRFLTPDAVLQVIEAEGLYRS